jgi:hypothetical protein
MQPVLLQPAHLSPAVLVQVLSAAMTGLQATFDSFPVTRVLHLGVAMAGISTSQGVLLSAGVTQTTGSTQPGGGIGGCIMALLPCP